MIDKHSAPGDCTDDMVNDVLYDEDPVPFTVFETGDRRVSEVLGPDGEPLVIYERRYPLGFCLKHRRQETS